MALFALAVALALQTPPSGVTLARRFSKGEKEQYSVHSHLQMQDRGEGMDTWIPTDYDLDYKFTSEVLQMLPDGVAKIRYKRPVVSETYGETYDAPARTVYDKVNYDFILRVSPANEILDAKDQAKKAIRAKWASREPLSQQDQDDLPTAEAEPYLQELARMSVFVSSFDMSLDYSPKLPFGPVEVGDTWKRTISYQPQASKDDGGRITLQRLDYTYTYDGIVTEKGKRFVRITAATSFQTDLAAYLMQTFDENTDLLKLPVQLTATIRFDLDPTTLCLIRAVARSEGGYQVFLNKDPDKPQRETKLGGLTVVQLIGTRK